jgi:glycosyltransferase involved in cell wall biosynthesis
VLTLTGVGYGAAIKAGAVQARGSLLALIDADGTYPESALPALVAAVRGGARQAIGARPKLGDSEPFARSAVKALFRGAVRWVGGFEAPDLNSGLRVLRTADLLSLAPVLPDRFSLTTTLTLALAAAGDPIVFLPIAYHARVGRSKWRPVRDTWLMGRTVARGIGWLRAGRAPRALVSLKLPAVGSAG